MFNVGNLITKDGKIIWKIISIAKDMVKVKTLNKYLMVDRCYILKETSNMEYEKISEEDILNEKYIVFTKEDALELRIKELEKELEILRSKLKKIKQIL